jgi:hypothetical protein
MTALRVTSEAALRDRESRSLRKYDAAVKELADAARDFCDAIDTFIADAGDYLTPEAGLSLMTSRDETYDTVSRLREFRETLKRQQYAARSAMHETTNA